MNNPIEDQTYWKRDDLWSLVISCTPICKGITREITENNLTKLKCWKETYLKGKTMKSRLSVASSSEVLLWTELIDSSTSYW